MKPLRTRFHEHKHSAAQRGIAFLLTFEEWLKIWEDSGHLAQRGNRKGCYQMARYGDKGPYAVGNVRIISLHENVIEACAGNSWNAGRKHSPEIRVKMSQAAIGRPATKGTKGFKHSAESKLKMRNAKKGKKLSAETREKMRQYHTGRKRPKSTCEKISAAKRARDKARMDLHA